MFNTSREWFRERVRVIADVQTIAPRTSEIPLADRVAIRLIGARSDNHNGRVRGGRKGLAFGR